MEEATGAVTESHVYTKETAKTSMRSLVLGVVLRRNQFKMRAQNPKPLRNPIFHNRPITFCMKSFTESDTRKVYRSSYM